MPYVDGDCATMPNAVQSADASRNNVTNWQTLNVNDVDGMKQALALDLPVVIAFRVNQSFINLWNTGGIWDTASSGDYLGNHATCIVGYDDTRKMFKVQNQWGTWGGDHGFFWVTYDLVRNSCLKEVYIVSGINLAYSETISGPSQVCGQATYSIDTGTSVSWNATPSGIVSLQPNGSSVALTKVGSGKVTLSATINNSFTVTKDVWVGAPSTPTSIGGFASNGLKFASVSQYSFYVQPVDIEGVNQYSWTVRSGSGTILDGQGTPVINFETADIANSLSFYVSVKVGNSCGWSSTFTRSGTIDGGIGQQAPKSKELFDDSVQAIEEVRDEANYNVLICDQLGRVVLQTTQKGADFSTSTSKIANGTYIVKLYNDKASMQKKVVVNHLR